jgi:hypothetical protein
MKVQDILRLRLSNQQISGNNLKKPEEVVARLGAIQAQDYSGAKWSIGLRIKNCSEKDVENAIADRSIVRTWPMRGTLHFIAAQDVRWMLSLLTPRILSGMAGRHRQLELNSAILHKSHDLLAKAMEGGRQLMRSEIYHILENQGLATKDQRGIHIINYLAQIQLLCHGTHNDKQPTYVLLDDWITDSRKIDGDEALSEITLRYFASHGPATIQDFAWWTALKVSDAKKGLQAVSGNLDSSQCDGDVYWFAKGLSDQIPAKTVHLLPGFDEYMLGYTNRSLMVGKEYLPRIVPGNNGMFMPTIVIDGEVKGLWKRTIQRSTASIEILPFDKITQTNLDRIKSAVRRYEKYLNMKLATSW